MRKITIPALFAAMLLLWACPARTAAPAAVDLSSLLSTLTYNYDNGQFSGDFGLTFYGIADGEVKAVIKNEAGNVVFERAIPCQSTYSSDDTPSCYLSSSDAAPAEPFAAQTGKYTLTFVLDGEPLYTFQYALKVDTQYEYNNVYVSGDWDRIATVDFSAEPGMAVRVVMGGPDVCNQKTEDVQVQLFRNGELAGRGHVEGAYYPGCSLSESTLMLFKTDENNFTEWISGKKQIFREGDYELKLFRDKQLAATYAFKLFEGGVTSVPPAGLQPGLLPDRVRTSEHAFIVYRK